MLWRMAAVVGKGGREKGLNRAELGKGGCSLCPRGNEEQGWGEGRLQWLQGKAVPWLL